MSKNAALGEIFIVQKYIFSGKTLFPLQYSSSGIVFPWRHIQTIGSRTNQSKLLESIDGYQQI